jgi:hypothetical protein
MLKTVVALRGEIAQLTVLLFLITLGIPLPTASAGGNCGGLNVPAIASDGLTVTVTSVEIRELDSSNLMIVNLELKNNSKDAKIDEGYLDVKFTDESVDWKGSRYFAMFPGDSFQRTYQWQYLKSIAPVTLRYGSRNSLSSVGAPTLYWPLLNETCSSLESADKAAADKAAADKAAADKAAADKAAADKAAADKAAADKAAAGRANSLKKTTIICVKGKLTKKVTAVTPKCPMGYKKK